MKGWERLWSVRRCGELLLESVCNFGLCWGRFERLVIGLEMLGTDRYVYEYEPIIGSCCIFQVLTKFMLMISSENDQRFNRYNIIKTNRISIFMWFRLWNKTRNIILWWYSTAAISDLDIFQGWLTIWDFSKRAKDIEVLEAVKNFCLSLFSAWGGKTSSTSSWVDTGDLHTWHLGWCGRWWCSWAGKRWW